MILPVVASAGGAGGFAGVLATGAGGALTGLLATGCLVGSDSPKIKNIKNLNYKSTIKFDTE